MNNFIKLVLSVSFVFFPSLVWADKNEFVIEEKIIFESEPIIRVKIGRGVIKTLPLETYLVGVIGREMSRRWPTEALRVQAVAARSYALYQILEERRENPQSRFDLVNTQADQVFNVRDIKDKNLKEIVDSTRGQVLFHEDHIVEAFYSSTCGGKSRLASDAGLSEDYPIKKRVSDSYCSLSPFKKWEAKAYLKDVEERLRKEGLPITNLENIRIKKRDKSGFVDEVRLITKDENWVISGTKLRWAVGSMRVKSTRFKMRVKDDIVTFIGFGFGHGVGMCQYGVKFMAQKSKKYDEILGKYYPKIPIVRIYE